MSLNLVGKPMRVWKLKSGFDRRFRAGHPWVYSNELEQSPKGVALGEAIELQDASGKFLAWGYGNPQSLISFRAVSRKSEERDALEVSGFARALLRAYQLRVSLGLKDVSFRLCFGEADHLPGLVIDRYQLDGHPQGWTQVFVVQAHTAGMDVRKDQIVQALERLTREGMSHVGCDVSWDSTVVVVRNEMGARKLEGLSTEGSGVVHPLRGAQEVRLSDCTIRVAAPEVGDVVRFKVDLIEGQKTGFFLDQAQNIEITARLLRAWAKAEFVNRKEPIRILDLCTYVGQWGTRLAHGLRKDGWAVEVTAFDASARALEFARQNVEAVGAKFKGIQGDVLKDLQPLASDSFDCVISDPPALVKSKKDLGPGSHAYLQMNTQAFRLLRRGGVITACSCSAQLPEEDFAKALSKAAFRNQKQVAWVARGSPAGDHPMRLEFPEGRYLKAWMGRVE